MTAGTKKRGKPAGPQPRKPAPRGAPARPGTAGAQARRVLIQHYRAKYGVK